MNSIYNATEALPSSFPLVIAVKTGSSLEVSLAYVWAISALAGVSLFAWFQKPWNDGNGHSIPKGPRGLPIIGNFSFPTVAHGYS